MDPTFLTKILAAGAMGVSIFCIYKVYDLLKKEQKEKKPRPEFLKSIYIFMAFAILMTLLSLAIEFARSEMQADKNLCEIYVQDSLDLVEKLIAISENDYFSVNKNGNSEEIKLEYGGQKYVLSKAFPQNDFEKSELKLIKRVKESDKHLVIKDNNGHEIVFGHISDADLKSITKGFFVDNDNKEFRAQKLMSLGILYIPNSTLKVVEGDLKKKKDRHLANKYLVDLISLKDHDRTLQGLAIKLLTQPESMMLLDSSQYEKLISVLKLGEIRPTPWDKYELAQVYLSRSWKSWNDNAVEDRIKSNDFLGEYVKYYEDKTNYWIRDTLIYPREYKWYKESK